MTDAPPILKAVPNDAVETDETPEPQPDTTGDEPPTPPTIMDTVLMYGETMQVLQTRYKIPHDKGLRLIEQILQYDVNRRHLALQEAQQMRDLQTQFQAWTPPSTGDETTDPSPDQE